jgi:glycosyltransferase involved in cell wall biosynthesis
MTFPFVPNKTGWPWTPIDSHHAAQAFDGESTLPKVSVITPSFNQGQFIEETIRSVLLQNYPNLEYIIIDGGSTDETLEIIERYKPWISHFASEPDRGQTHAINKGLRIASGDILAWLNSDDIYLPDAINTSINALQENSDVSFVYGHALFVDEKGNTIKQYSAYPLKSGYHRMKYWKGWMVPQPTLFFKRQLLDRYGYLDETMNYAMDYEWIIRISQHNQYECIDQAIATYRRHRSSKTGDFILNREKFHRETLRTNLLYAAPYKITTWPLWISWITHKLFESFAKR